MTALVPDVIAGVPVLMARPHRPHGSPPPPVVLWFHGFRADALANAAELQRIARAGYLAVGIDAVGHGRRIDPALAARIAGSPGGALPVMQTLAAATAEEIPSVLDAIASRGLGDTGRAALVGVSMGAFLVYRALLDVPVRAAVAILGSPVWPGPRNPALVSPEAFADVALLSITAERDERVPPRATRERHDRLDAATPASLRHRYLELAGAPHLLDAPRWARVMDHTMDWLTAVLR